MISTVSNTAPASGQIFVQPPALQPGTILPQSALAAPPVPLGNNFYLVQPIQPPTLDALDMLSLQAAQMGIPGNISPALLNNAALSLSGPSAADTFSKNELTPKEAKRQEQLAHQKEEFQQNKLARKVALNVLALQYGLAMTVGLFMGVAYLALTRKARLQDMKMPSKAMSTGIVI